MNDEINKPLDWAAADRDLQIFCEKCAKVGKTPLEFGACFNGRSLAEPLF
jgi:hypothetical protein